MLRLVRLFSALAIVVSSTSALACRTSGLGVQLGSVFLGFSKNRPCPPWVVAQAVVPIAAPPPPVYAPPPPVYSPPPVVYAEPPVVYTAPPVVYAPPVVTPAPVVRAKPAPPRNDRPGFLALKYMPGASSDISLGAGRVGFDTVGFAHSPGIEFRLTRWLSLRSDLEFRQGGRTWDMLGVKLSLFPRSPVKPYASVSFGANENYLNPGKFSFGLAGAAGLDVFLGRYFFLEAEVRYRATPGACCSDVPSLTAVVGGGVAFF